MKNLLFLFLIFLMSCKTNPSEKEKKELISKLEEMVGIDQIAADIPKGKYKELSEEKWKQFKDSIFSNHKIELEKLFNKYGFLGYDLVGEKGSHNFWLLVQHCDKFPDFQQKVLKEMKLQVKNKNASPINYAYLIDRVRLNTNQQQVYGTQVDYNWKVCQAFPKNLEDSINVNKRRNEIGLERIEDYLNEMSKLHFEVNRSVFEIVGVKGPKLYTIEKK